MSITTKVLPIPDRAAQDRLARARRDEVMDSMRAASSDPVRWVPTRAQVALAVDASRELDELEVDEIERIDWHQAQLDGQSLRFAELVGYQGGLTALLHAVRAGHRDAAFILLEGGADINQAQRRRSDHLPF